MVWLTDERFLSFHYHSDSRLRKIMKHSPHKIERQAAYGILVNRMGVRS